MSRSGWWIEEYERGRARGLGEADAVRAASLGEALGLDEQDPDDAPTEAERNSWVAPIEDKPAPAADAEAEQLRVIAGELNGPRRMIVNRAADRIEAQAREIAELRAGVTVNGQRSDAFEARVRELEARALTQVDADEWRKSEERADYQKARADRLAAAVADHVKYLEATGGPVPTVLWEALTTEGGDRG